MMDRSKMRTYSRKKSSYLKKAFIASNFNEMCRLCLSETVVGLTPIVQDSDKISYKEWIEYGLDVRVEEGDGLPPNICEPCLALVEQMYLFKKKCKTSDSKLREHLELVEISDVMRTQQLGFSDLEDDPNLFRRHGSTQEMTNGDENNGINSGETGEETQNNANQDISAIQDIDANPDIDANQDINANEDDMVEIEIYDDDDEVEGVHTKYDLRSIYMRQGQRGGVQIRGGKGARHTQQEAEKRFQRVDFENDIDVTCMGSQGNDSNVQRFILKGEKKPTGDGDEEEDLSVFEVVPVEKNEECVDVPENSDEEDAGGAECPPQKTQTETPEESLQVISQQWQSNNDPEQVVCLEPDTMNAPTGETTLSVDRHMFMVTPINEKRQNNRSGIVHRKSPEKPDPYEVNRIYRTKNRVEIIETVPSATRYLCCTCPNTYPTIPELREHLYAAHEISEATSCEVCYKTFTCTNSLRRHMLIHTGYRPHVCPICDKGFTQSSTLKRHNLLHGGEKPFACHYCDKSYTQKMNLLAHLKTHGILTQALIFTCKACNKSFVHQSGLSRHLKEHKGFRFMCSNCNRSFIDPSALQRHIKRIHERKLSPTRLLNLIVKTRR